MKSVSLSPGESSSQEAQDREGLFLLRATFDRAPIGMAQFDVDGRFLRVNDRLCEILGFTREELLVRTFQEITFPDDLPHCLELTARLAGGAIPNYSVEKRFIRADGSSIWTRITVSAVREPSGTPAFFIGVAEDISEQIAANEARRGVEDRLRAALSASAIGTFRFDVRRNALDWADGLESLFGGVRNRTLDQFFEQIHPADSARVMESYVSSAANGTDFEEEFRVVWPDGSVHWLHDRAQTIAGADGRPHYIIGAITDITNHKRMQEVIGEREAQLRTLADTIPQIVWIANSDGSRTWFNQRWFEYTGYGLEEMKDFGWLRVHHPDYMDQVLANQRAAFASGTVWEDTVRLRSKDGEYRWFLSRAMPVRTVDGEILQWFGTNTDITDRLEAEQRLQQLLEAEAAARAQAEEAIKLRHQVLGVVAHDLRDPVQTIVMAAGSLLELPLPEQQRTHQLEIIKRSAWRMNRLIGDLLDVSRIEAGTLAVRHERVTIAPLLSEVSEAFESRARSSGITLQTEVNPRVPPIIGDRERLVQVLSNLVANALKFTPQGGRISLRARQIDLYVDIAVEDTGIGIDADHQPKIFERFWQANRVAGGAGLGLVIAKGIVEAHGGRISVESVLGEGTTFHVRLPLTDLERRAN